MTVALVEAIKHSHRDIVDLLISQGAKVDGQNSNNSMSPLIAVLEGENTYAISKLLSHMEDLKILGQVQDADYWRVATYLTVNYGISTESILRALPRSEVTGKRLRCAFFRCRSRHQFSTNNNNFSHEACSVRRPAVSSGHLDKSKGIITGNHSMSHNSTEVSRGFADFLGLASNVGEGLQIGIDSY